MKKINTKKLYGFLTITFIGICIVVLSATDMNNSVYLSHAIQFLLILYLSKTMYGCILYIKEQYKKQKYSYSIIMNLGLVIFLLINIGRQIQLLIFNFGKINIKDIYLNTLQSFSHFAVLTVPFIIFLTVYGIVSNIALIKKEGFSFANLLGIIFGIVNLISVIAGQIVYKFTANIPLDESKMFIKYFIDISLNIVISYWYCLVLATLYCNIMAANHKPEYDKDFIIILGSKIKNNGTLTPLLKARVDKAIDFANNQLEGTNKEVIYVASGGKGRDEVIAESEAIKNYLVENGIDSKNIIVENQSTNTNENLKFSKEKIDEVKKDGKIAFSTTNYHVFRSGVIANNRGIDCEGMGSKTKWYFYSNALIREFVANLFYQRKEHIGLILSINVVVFVLVFVGYKYNFISSM